MGAAKTSGLIEGGDKRRGDEGPDARGGGQPLHHRVGGRGLDDRGIGDGQVLGQLRPQNEEGPERGLQLGRKRELLHVGAEPVGIPRPHPQALTADQRTDERDGPAAGPHQQVADAELPPHLALFGRHAMGRTIGADPAGLGQHPGIAPIGLHPAAPLGIHGRVVGIRHDDVVPTALKRLGHPFAFRGRLEQHRRPWSRGEHGGEAVPRALDAPLEDFALGRQNTDLTFPLVDVDANMLHDWPLFLRFERVSH